MPKKSLNKRPPRREENQVRPPATAGHVKIYADEPLARFEEIGVLVEQGLLKWVYYSTEGKLGYHCYKQVIKKK